MPTPASIPASTRRRSARSRWRGGAVPGSVVRQIASSSVGTENVTWTVGASRRLGEDVDVADDHRAAGDDAERVPGLGERLEAAASQAEASLRRLVGIRGRPDDDRLVGPALPGELAAEHLDDVDLDPDRLAVAVVRRAVGALLERPDVAERASVGAAHVRVERPLEWHARHAVDGSPAGLLSIRGGHGP